MIKRVRSEATEEGLKIFTWEYMKYVTKQKMKDNSIFNKDKKKFSQMNKTRKVIAVIGSKNVWSKNVEEPFHITIVACVAAMGLSVPPLLILPVQRLNCATMDQCSINGRTETVAPKGLMKSNIFIKWLDHFSSNVPSHVKRPFVIVYDGYGRNYNTDIVEKDNELRIILVLLPSNSNHLIQPLDILVFKQFKTEFKHQIEKFMIENSCTSFTKKDAIVIAFIGSEKGIINKPETIDAGFKAGGLWPVSFPQMQSRWCLFYNGGVNFTELSIVPWITTWEVARTEILSLPIGIDRTRKRKKTLDVKNRLLKLESLNIYDD